MPDLLRYPPVASVQTVSFLTDVLEADDGTEQRISRRKKPRQTYDLDVNLENETAIREWRRNLFNRGTEAFYLPIWHEVMRTGATSQSGDTNVQVDLTYSDLASGDLVLLMSVDGADYQVHTVDTVTASDFEAVGTHDQDYAAGSLVVPVELALLADGAGYDRYPLNAASMPVRATVQAHKALGGNGAASLSTYNSLTLLDARPLMTGKEARRFQWSADRVDYGGVIVQSTGRTYAQIVTPRRYAITSAAERQWWKLLLDTQVGAREPLYAPTWRDDLVVDTQPSFGAGAWTELVVEDEPDWITEYASSGAHGHVQLEGTQGGTPAVGQFEVSSAVDNADGTITLTMSSTMTGWVVERVSFLEHARFGDTFRFVHEAGGNSFVDCTLEVVQQ